MVTQTQERRYVYIQSVEYRVIHRQTAGKRNRTKNCELKRAGRELDHPSHPENFPDSGRKGVGGALYID